MQAEDSGLLNWRLNPSFEKLSGSTFRSYEISIPVLSFIIFVLQKDFSAVYILKWWSEKKKRKRGIFVLFRIIDLVRLTLLRLLEAACPCCPSRWLHLCRNVILAASTTVRSGGRPGALEGDSRSAVDVPTGDATFADDEEGMIVRANKAGQSGSSLSGLGFVESKSKEGEQVPRYSTRLFAAECLSRVPAAVGDDPRHFDLVLAKEDRSHCDAARADWLVLQLGQLVALAYQVATGVFESIRPKGVMLLVTVLDKFGETEDPDFNDHLLLEQYQAQFVSAVRTALDSSAGPLLLDAGLQLAARIITSGISSGDAGVFRRVIALISRPLNNFDHLQYSSYAEWVGCKVQVSLLSAYAAVKIYAYSCMREHSEKAKEGTALLTLLASDLAKLKSYWIGLLKDFLMLQISKPSQLQSKYIPFLGGLLLPAVASIVQPYLDEVWPLIVEAVTIDVVPAASLAVGSCNSAFEARVMGDSETLPQSSFQITSLSAAEFHPVWAVCFSTLCLKDKQGRNKPFPSCSFHIRSYKPRSLGNIQALSDSHVIALDGIQCLCKEGFYHPNMLSCDLCQELFQVLMGVGFKSHLSASTHVLPILKEVLKSCPDDYFESDELMLAVTEICMYYGHKVLSSVVAEASTSFFEVDSLMCSIFETLEILAQRSNCERQSQLLPILLCVAMKFITIAPVIGSSLSAAVTFVSGLAKLLVKSSGDQKASILASIVQTLAQLSATCIRNSVAEEKLAKDMEEGTLKLPIVLSLMMAVAQNIMEVSVTTVDEIPVNTAKTMVLEQVIDCLRCVLTAQQTEVQLAGLQTLRSMAQASIAEQNQGSTYELTLLFMRELGAAVVAVVYNSIKVSLTAKVASAVGESLKLLVLLHSLVQGDEAQIEVLHVLLPAIISSASVDVNDESQIALGLRAVAVKLVTHLASQPDCAAQFRSVLLEMPNHLRQRLQDIVRASVSQQSSNSSAVPPSSFPIASQKLVIPIMPPGLKPASEALPQSSDQDEHSLPSASQDSCREEDVDEDWDDFQFYPETLQVRTSCEAFNIAGKNELDTFNGEKSEDVTREEEIDRFQEDGVTRIAECHPEKVNSVFNGENGAELLQGEKNSSDLAQLPTASVDSRSSQFFAENVNDFDSFQAEVLSDLTQLSTASINSTIQGEDEFGSIPVVAQSVEGQAHHEELLDAFHAHTESTVATIHGKDDLGLLQGHTVDIVETAESRGGSSRLDEDDIWQAESSGEEMEPVAEDS